MGSSQSQSELKSVKSVKKISQYTEDTLHIQPPETAVSEYETVLIKLKKPDILSKPVMSSIEIQPKMPRLPRQQRREIRKLRKVAQ